MKKFYTTAELAAMLGCSKETVKSAVDRKEISAVMTPGGHARIGEAEAKKVVEERGGVWDERSLDDMVGEFEARAKVVIAETLDLFSVSVLNTKKKKGDVNEIIDEAVSKMKESAVEIFGG